MIQCSRATTKPMTAGLDLGDKYSHLCLIDTQSGELLEEERLRTTPEALKERFASEEPLKIALEVGTHSPWVSRLLSEGCGHEVLVANARKVRLIYAAKNKTDKLDAQKLARLARFDPELLAPIEHRDEGSQADLALVRSREALVKSRTQLVNHVRGSVKSFGDRLPRCSTASFHKKCAELIPKELEEALHPLMQTIASLSERIGAYDKRIERLASEKYPETKALRQVKGVGALSALSFVLTLEDPRRFEDSRRVGAYLGLTPSKDQSGDSDPQKRISKEGDEFLRGLLIQSAHYILGPFGEDCDLRRHGQKIHRGGSGKSAKKRAVVAVARKLSVLLHQLWITGEVYEPLYNERRRSSRLAPAEDHSAA